MQKVSLLEELSEDPLFLVEPYSYEFVMNMFKEC